MGLSYVPFLNEFVMISLPSFSFLPLFLTILYICRNLLLPFLVCSVSLYSEDMQTEIKYFDKMHPILVSKNETLPLIESGNQTGSSTTNQSNSVPTTTFETKSLFPILFGNQVSPSHTLFAPDGVETIYFIFSFLSIRRIGTFRLQFNLINLMSGIQSGFPHLTINQGPCISSLFSTPFTVFPSHEYHGLPESTALTKFIASQGIKLPLRNSTG